MCWGWWALREIGDLMIVEGLLWDLLSGLAIAVIVHSLEGSSIALAIHSLDPSLSAQLIAPLIPPYKKVEECVGDGRH